MQPLAEVTSTRPWHWGIAVRHAQDLEADTFEGDWEWAAATLQMRSFLREERQDGEDG